MGDITKNFSYAEFEASATAKAKGIDNVAPAGARAAIAARSSTPLSAARKNLSTRKVRRPTSIARSIRRCISPAVSWRCSCRLPS